MTAPENGASPTPAADEDAGTSGSDPTSPSASPGSARSPAAQRDLVGEEEEMNLLFEEDVTLDQVLDEAEDDTPAEATHTPQKSGGSRPDQAQQSHRAAQLDDEADEISSDSDTPDSDTRRSREHPDPASPADAAPSKKEPGAAAQSSKSKKVPMAALSLEELSARFASSARAKNAAVRDLLLRLKADGDATTGPSPAMAQCLLTLIRTERAGHHLLNTHMHRDLWEAVARWSEHGPPQAPSGETMSADKAATPVPEEASATATEIADAAEAPPSDEKADDAQQKVEGTLTTAETVSPEAGNDAAIKGNEADPSLIWLQAIWETFDLVASASHAQLFHKPLVDAALAAHQLHGPIAMYLFNRSRDYPLELLHAWSTNDISQQDWSGLARLWAQHHRVRDAKPDTTEVEDLLPMAKRLLTAETDAKTHREQSKTTKTFALGLEHYVTHVPAPHTDPHVASFLPHLLSSCKSNPKNKSQINTIIRQLLDHVDELSLDMVREMFDHISDSKDQASLAERLARALEPLDVFSSEEERADAERLISLLKHPLPDATTGHIASALLSNLRPKCDLSDLNHRRLLAHQLKGLDAPAVEAALASADSASSRMMLIEQLAHSQPELALDLLRSGDWTAQQLFDVLRNRAFEYQHRLRVLEILWDKFPEALREDANKVQAELRGIRRRTALCHRQPLCSSFASCKFVHLKCFENLERLGIPAEKWPEVAELVKIMGPAGYPISQGFLHRMVLNQLPATADTTRFEVICALLTPDCKIDNVGSMLNEHDVEVYLQHMDPQAALTEKQLLKLCATPASRKGLTATLRVCQATLAQKLAQAVLHFDLHAAARVLLDLADTDLLTTDQLVQCFRLAVPHEPAKVAWVHLNALSKAKVSLEDKDYEQTLLLAVQQQAWGTARLVYMAMCDQAQTVRLLIDGLRGAPPDYHRIASTIFEKARGANQIPGTGADQTPFALNLSPFLVHEVMLVLDHYRNTVLNNTPADGLQPLHLTWEGADVSLAPSVESWITAHAPASVLRELNWSSIAPEATEVTLPLDLVRRLVHEAVDTREQQVVSPSSNKVTAPREGVDLMREAKRARTTLPAPPAPPTTTSLPTPPARPTPPGPPPAPAMGMTSMGSSQPEPKRAKADSDPVVTRGPPGFRLDRREVSTVSSHNSGTNEWDSNSRSAAGPDVGRKASVLPGFRPGHREEQRASPSTSAPARAVEASGSGRSGPPGYRPSSAGARAVDSQGTSPVTPDGPPSMVTPGSIPSVSSPPAGLPSKVPPPPPTPPPPMADTQSVLAQVMERKKRRHGEEHEATTQLASRVVDDTIKGALKPALTHMLRRGKIRSKADYKTCYKRIRSHCLKLQNMSSGELRARIEEIVTNFFAQQEFYDPDGPQPC
ncbi:uncharacterized protein MONBRDRAFT_33091 [Monosiga brevicollis MX1]|uniref:Uncharacterized protein n=1 Tax=Monosiga brevicollis TaxID=81824 RepID=A9V3N4_MONBE|nr:uncharacterized protein MONBRDRAFT_33091 [Monosiga brevicollis MX1]EDQ87844.1 predicted protein [Monosiga brevicollis MX1]|eukprot:XP_001747377.1 hypothetical protein [Monosiga brevicollis MX1]